MSYRDEWISIAGRIAGLQSAESIRAANKNPESFGASGLVQDECARVAAALEIFGKVHDATLPRAAKAALARCLTSRPILDVRGSPWDKNSRSAIEAVVALSLLGSEMTYVLTDRQELLRSRSARAFLHLQQTLMASGATRKEWREAFKAGGEVPCEKLGGTHLLLHGIYAFKAAAAGAETDLVFGEPLDISEVARTSEGLVLTEWKVADDEKEAAGKFEEAFAQSQRYSVTALASVILRAYRYNVVVTEKPLPQPIVEAGRREKEGIIYVPINIAFDPVRVSAQAKADVRAAKKSGKPK